MPTTTLPLLPSTTRPVEIKSWCIFLSFEWPYIAVLIILMGCCFVDLNQNFHPWFFFRWLNYLRQQIQNNIIFSLLHIQRTVIFAILVLYLKWPIQGRWGQFVEALKHFNSLEYLENTHHRAGQSFLFRRTLNASSVHQRITGRIGLLVIVQQALCRS